MTSVTDSRIVIRGGTILSLHRQAGNLPCGDLLIEGESITHIAPSIAEMDAPVIDASNMLVLPGFVDSHRHAWRGALQRPRLDAAYAQEYLSAGRDLLASHYRPLDMYIGTLLTALNCIDTGITTAIDASHNAISPEHTYACRVALDETGIRALHMTGKTNAGLEHTRWLDGLTRLKTERFSSTEQLLTLGVYSHLNAQVWERAIYLDLPIVTDYVQTPTHALPHLSHHLARGLNVILNRCTGLTDEGWELLSDTPVKITVSPQSDARSVLKGRNSFSIPRSSAPYALALVPTPHLTTRETCLRKCGLRCCFDEAQRIHQRPRCHRAVRSRLRIDRVLEALTMNGARCAGLDGKIGSLTPGKKADLIRLRLDENPRALTDETLSAILQGAQRLDRRHGHSERRSSQ